MTNAQTIEVSTRQIDYAQCRPAPRLARDRFMHLSHEIDNTFANALPFELPQENALFLSAQNEWQQAQKLSKAILAHFHPPDGGSAAQKIKHLDDQLDNHTGRAVESINQIYYVAHREITEDLARANAVKRQQLPADCCSFRVGAGNVLITSIVLTRSILLPLHVLNRGVGRFCQSPYVHGRSSQIAE